MTPFTAPLDDIFFSLSAVARVDSLPGADPALLREIAAAFARLAEDILAPLNVVGDREGARLVDGRVLLPDGFQQAYRAFCDQGWPGLTLPEAFGGQGMGQVALALVSEIYSGANHAMQMVTGLAPGAAKLLLVHGSPAQQAEALPRIANGTWLTTMALTEAGAGSDLGRIRCRASRSGEAWQISGEKIFISGGDQNLSEGVLHLVLARTGEGGVKGLSLFYCPSHRADGRRNAVSVQRLEEKLGIHASPTCQLLFDAAEASLIGSEGGGLTAMFTLMNEARLDVSLQAVAHSARAHDLARRYAGDRVQGRGADGQPVTIDQHPDVQRMLEEIDLRALGTRGLVHLALAAMERGDDALVELLTPLAKAWCSDRASEAADLAIQVLGGYGYLEEYGLAQVWRDARICRTYEGANGIHSMMLATRTLRQGEPLDALDALICTEPRLAQPRDRWRAARQRLEAQADPRPYADAFLQLTGELVHALVWLRLDDAADLHPDPTRIRALALRARRRFRWVNEQYNAQFDD